MGHPRQVEEVRGSGGARSLDPCGHWPLAVDEGTNREAGGGQPALPG